MKAKRLLSLIRGSALILLLAVPVVTAQAQQPVKLRLATGPSRWSMYVYAVKAAELLNRYSHLEITVEATGGTSVMLKGLIAGIKDIGGPNDISGTTAAYRGTAKWKKPNKQLRVLLAMGGLYRTYVTKPGSGIKTFLDLKGNTVPRYTRDRATWQLYDGLYKVYGIGPKTDFKEIPLAGGLEARDDLIMGRLDAYMTSANTRMLLPLQEAIGQIAFIPLEREKILEAREKYPNLMLGQHPGVVTQDLVPGVKISGPLQTTFAPRMLTTTASLSDDVAYTIVKTIISKYKEYQSTVPDFSPKKAAVEPDVPYHSGAVKAFKELGLWTVGMEKAQKALLAAN